MARAVVAGVHDDELAIEAVGFAESLAAGGVEADIVVMRPRGQDGDLFGVDAFGQRCGRA